MLKTATVTDVEKLRTRNTEITTEVRNVLLACLEVHIFEVFLFT